MPSSVRQGGDDRMHHHDPPLPRTIEARCGVWPADDGPCGEPEVERIHYLNAWMDHPGHGQARVQGKGINPSDVDDDPGPALGLPLCSAHLSEYARGQLL
jgi:hypothetical protein